LQDIPLVIYTKYPDLAGAFEHVVPPVDES
jgi:hypothetical protein